MGLSEFSMAYVRSETYMGLRHMVQQVTYWYTRSSYLSLQIKVLITMK